MTIDSVDVSVYEFPLEEPESDGTLTWDSTTMVVVEVAAGDARGLGYTYGSAACATVIREKLADVVVGTDPMDATRTWSAMQRAVRNVGRPGVVSHAMSAVDTSVWDLKARLLEVPLATLLGGVHDAVPVYGSGGFTSMSDQQMEKQLSEWVHELGIPRVKIKVAEDWGRRERRDLARAELARRVIGADAELFVDANGGYSRKQAVRMARRFSDHGVTWFEEPVSSDDLDGLHEIRDLVDQDVAAGEYGYDLAYFRHMLAAGAVDCLQADVTRCGGVTEFLRVAGLAAAQGLELSAHTAAALSLAPSAAIPNLRHVEWFADHAAIEAAALDGAPTPEGGMLRPDRSRPGNGLALKRSDIEQFRKG